MKVIDIDHVTLRRGGRTILNDICWIIEQGQHWALLGANGSGKTTLLKVLTGYEWPTSGRVSVLQKRHGEYDLRRLRKSIGWVSNVLEHQVPRQDSALEITASGFDSSFGVYRELDDASRVRCREALDSMSIGSFEAQAFATLSQGEQKRALIARALVNRPALLVLDEPCAGLDPASRASFLDDLGNLTQTPQGPTLLLVTHHVEEIPTWIGHAMILKEGRVIARGPIGDALTSAALTEAFSQECEVHMEDGHYRMSLKR